MPDSIKEILMNIRRILWGVIAILTLMLMSLAGAIAWFGLRTMSQPSQLVIVGADGQLRLFDQGRERVIAEQVDASQYRFPAISPDGRAMVFTINDGPAMAIVRLDVATGQRIELYRSEIHKSFDLAWSPDGRYVTFLQFGRTGLTTQIVPQDGSAPPRVIATGGSSYFAWRDDGSALLLHQDGHMEQGGRIELYTPGEDQSRPLVSDPGLFQASAWSIDGASFFYVAQPPINKTNPSLEDVQSQIVRVDADGQNPQVLVGEQLAHLRIVRSPTSNQLAYVSFRPDSRGGIAWSALKLIDPAGGEPRIISRPDERVTTFFWSPDGTQIAYLTYDDTFDDAGRRSLHTVDLAGGTVRDHATFTPSQALIELQLFFDAYLFSFSPWSPDSRRFAYGTDSGVYVLDIQSGETERIADGMLGMWTGGEK
jgi:TolB protein